MPALLTDRTDFQNAERGLIARLEPGLVADGDGRIVYDIDSFAAAVQGECPATVDPSLWRQGRLTAIQGLLEVADGVYQVRGLDLSNMTLIESANGVIVIDPLISAECATAALTLYRKHRGERTVTAVIYTHAHIDHFGGVLGVVDADTDVPIIAPEHFMEYAVSENVYAGTAMLRRGMYYGGDALTPGADGTIGMGLGPRGSTGPVGLLAPTLDITHTAQEETVDGVRIVFQKTPGTESPAEMNVFFPERRVLCLAENATHNLHNLLTLRGAQVRDPRIWSRYLAEVLQVPAKLNAAWHTHGYYGSVSHNVKAIYQRYLGWYDGNPAHLWQHPPREAAQRYARLIGGANQLAAKAREFLDENDFRFAAELASHAVFADPDSAAARGVLSQALTRLGYGAENATWRNCFLMGAKELSDGIKPTAIAASAGMARAMTVTQLFDTISIRIDGPRAADTTLSILWHFSDRDEHYLMQLSNGVLIHHRTDRTPQTDLTVTLTHPQLLGLLGSGALNGLDATGNPAVLKTLMDLTDGPDPNFDVVTP